MKIQVIKGCAGYDENQLMFSFVDNEIVDVSDALGTKLIADGYAESVEKPKPTAKKTTKDED